MAQKIILLILVLFLSFPQKTEAAMNPKVKVLGLTAAYGTVGGALLGAASLAFGAGGRAVAQGAALGLYAGLIYGTYIVLSYKEPNTQVYPEDAQSPYGGDGAYEPSGPYGKDLDYRWRPQAMPTKGLERPTSEIPVYLNVIQFNF